MNKEIRPLLVLIKGLIFFAFANLLYAMIDPPLSLSAYNTLFAGRARMPFDDHGDSYTVMVDDIEVMLESHVVSSIKEENEFRVLLIGDSSIWQEEVPVPETFSEYWNAKKLQCNGRQMRFYNLGYPHPSVIKDLVVIQEAIRNDPDLILWFVTANTIMPRLVTPFIEANREKTIRILDTYDLSLSGEGELRGHSASMFDGTIVGERTLLARWIKLQVLGLTWLATGVDYHEHQDSEASVPENNLPYKINYFGYEPGTNFSSILEINALTAGYDLAGDTPMMLINEPIFIASGENSELLYNANYPRWAYDLYRSTLITEAEKSGWDFIDAWNIVPPQHFLTPLHVSAEGGQIMTDYLTPFILKNYCN